MSVRSFGATFHVYHETADGWTMSPGCVWNITIPFWGLVAVGVGGVCDLLAVYLVIRGYRRWRATRQ